MAMLSGEKMVHGWRERCGRWGHVQIKSISYGCEVQKNAAAADAHRI